jgi:uncharacterized sulfatase
VNADRSDRPNIVWLTLDSIRYDRTSMGEHSRDTTPNMQRIASLPGGETFSQCITTARWSLPSVASMLTGTYQRYHGMGSRTEVLPEEIDTVAERLADRGYYTAGLSANSFFAEETGLDRGFERFEQLNAGNFARVADVRSFSKFALGIGRHSAGFDLDKRKHRPDFLVNELAKRRLESFAGEHEPFFFAAHYHGAHHPYYPPLAFQDVYTDEIGMSSTEASEIAFARTTDVYEGMAEAESFAPAEWEAIRAMYDTLVAYTDGIVGDFFDHLRSLDLDDTIVVITADHGDLLGERDLLSHKLVLHDALVRVPLVVHGFEDLLGRGDDLLQHVDIVRTLLERVGGRTNGLQGYDLRERSRDFAISQCGPGTSEGLDIIQSHDEDFDRSAFHESALTALRSTEFKYQRSDDGSELFELPDETEDVSATYPEKVAEFDEYLTEWLADHEGRSIEGTEAQFSDEVRQQLADLGYRTE